jgi:N-acetylmuramoyl-L-alanine amidase
MQRRVTGRISTLAVALTAALVSPLLMVPALAGTATAARLRSVELTAAASGLTLELRLSRPVRARVTRLTAPRRWVLDLPATRQSLRAPVPAARGSLRALRVAEQRDGTLRLVLELDAEGSAELLPAAVAETGETLVRIAVHVNAGVANPNAAAANAGRDAVMAPKPAATAGVTARHAPANTGRDVIIAVDAGHGGVDPGASGRDGTQEKRVTLAIARRLAQALNDVPGIRAMLTRGNDSFVPLRERAARARRARADLFISIHADAVRDRDIDGASVYVLSERGASSEAARILADRENAADLKGVPLGNRSTALDSVLVDLSQNAAKGASAEVAMQVLVALDAVGVVRKREVQQAGFVVLKSPDLPSLLVETAYISNPQEERKLRSDEYQRKLTAAMATGIGSYFRAHPPDGSRFAREREAAAREAGAGVAGSR